MQIRRIQTYEETLKVRNFLAEHFPDHKNTFVDLVYAFHFVAFDLDKVIGVITAQRYLPKKAILCDIAVDEEHRGTGIAIRLLERLSVELEKFNITHLIGITDPDNRAALSTYRRCHVKQDMYVITCGELRTSIPHMKQLIERLDRRNK